MRAPWPLLAPLLQSHAIASVPRARRSARRQRRMTGTAGIARSSAYAVWVAGARLHRPPCGRPAHRRAAQWRRPGAALPAASGIVTVPRRLPHGDAALPDAYERGNWRAASDAPASHAGRRAAAGEFGGGQVEMAPYLMRPRHGHRAAPRWRRCMAALVPRRAGAGADEPLPPYVPPLHAGGMEWCLAACPGCSNDQRPAGLSPGRPRCDEIALVSYAAGEPHGPLPAWRATTSGPPTGWLEPPGRMVAPALSGQRDLHVDVAARGVGVGADLADLQARGDAVGVGDGAQVHFGVDGQVLGQGDLLLAGHGLDGADEAGRVAGGEQLLGIGARAAGAGRRQGHVQAAVIGARGAIAAAGGVGAGGVQELFSS
ncbi:hypothetical protein FQR65_LT20556 [Abscondita terminalis]|nr:hypothetical protein FQR65_LT20556 [Abscondita terminalis]